MGFNFYLKVKLCQPQLGVKGKIFKISNCPTSPRENFLVLYFSNSPRLLLSALSHSHGMTLVHFYIAAECLLCIGSFYTLKCLVSAGYQTEDLQYGRQMLTSLHHETSHMPEDPTCTKNSEFSVVGSNKIWIEFY